MIARHHFELQALAWPQPSYSSDDSPIYLNSRVFIFLDRRLAISAYARDLGGVRELNINVASIVLVEYSPTRFI